MFKKKDKLFDLIKNPQLSKILQYLSNQDLHQFALLNKKYYLLLLPFIKLKQEDDSDKDSKENNKKGKNKNKKDNINKNKENTQCAQDKKMNKQDNVKLQMNNLSISITQKQTQVNVQKMHLSKWFKLKTTILPQWQRIQSIPFYNQYLNQKLNSKNYIFYQNKMIKQSSTQKQIMFINRSIIDPNLNFDKGSFNDQLQLQDIYQHMYQENQNNKIQQIDFTSREMLLKRQKQMLEKINKKKIDNIEKQTISYEKELQKACKMKKYAIILCFGGSFSIGIYQGSKCVTHKSDKKYVCRKKAGQRQLNKDKQSGSSIKSMGSQIRRDQQKKHIINVNQILNEFKNQLFACQIIFLQAPGINRLFIINENQTMAQLQNKLRSVCLTAKKANYTQVQALNQAINLIHIVKIKE